MAKFKPLFFVLCYTLVCVWFTACNYKNEPAADEQNADSAATLKALPDSMIQQPDALLPWSINFDDRTKTRNIQFSKNNENIDSIIAGINALYPEVGLHKIKLSGDTLYTDVAHSKILADEMGSSGAADYIATVVINCTTLPNIHFVSVQLPAGSHLSGDVWSTDQFADYTIKP